MKPNLTTEELGEAVAKQIPSPEQMKEARKGLDNLLKRRPKN